MPGEYRAPLRRLIVTQGDTEPASVEQQRRLGLTCPSLYDLRNLFQINVEEGRHLWAMVYLLHAYFGRDGREEAEAMLERHSGDADRPRILGAFNEVTPNWLSYLMFTFFTDRDGKYQLAALAESGFDPLSRTCRFMLTEEAHHMFVGETGVMRVVQRTGEVMNGSWAPTTRSACGKRESLICPRCRSTSTSTTAFRWTCSGRRCPPTPPTTSPPGLKGRYLESRLDDDHRLAEDLWPVHTVRDGRIAVEQMPALGAVNERLRDDYIKDCQRGLDRWNRALESLEVDFRLDLPHRFFNRRIGNAAGLHVSPDGRVISEEEWQSNVSRWLPTGEDMAYVDSLMHRVIEPGQDRGLDRAARARHRRKALGFRVRAVRVRAVWLRDGCIGNGRDVMQQHAVEVDAGVKPSGIAYPDVFNVAVPFIDRHLDEVRGGKTAIVFDDTGETVTYGQLAERVNRCGNLLRSLAWESEGRVLMVVKDCPEFFYVFWGAIKAGLIPVPLNTLLRAADYQHIIEDSKCAGLVYSPEYRERGHAGVGRGRPPADLHTVH